MHRLDLIPNKHFRSNSIISSSNSTSIEEEQAFLSFEKEERENEIKENNENENENMDMNSKKIANTIIENNKVEYNKKETSRSYQGLEFSLYVDENSMVDLYLELIKGVEQENYSSNRGEVVVVSSSNNDMSSNNSSYNGGSGSINIDNISSSLSSKRNATSSNNNDNDSSINGQDAKNNHPSKRQKTESDNYDKNGDNNITSNKMAEKKGVKYHTKYYDIATYNKLYDLYMSCKGVLLDSLVLSEGMLALLGYHLSVEEAGEWFICMCECVGVEREREGREGKWC